MEIPSILRNVQRFLSAKKYFNLLPRTYCCPPAASTSPDNKKALVLGIYENDKEFIFTSTANEFNNQIGGKLCELLKQVECRFKLGTSFAFSNIHAEYTTVVLTALGSNNVAHNDLEVLNECKENVRLAIGAAIMELKIRGCVNIVVDNMGQPEAAAEAAVLASWNFQEYKHCAGRETTIQKIIPYTQPCKHWERGFIKGQAQNWARYLSDMPANKMTPVDFAQTVLDCLCPLGVQVEARDRDWIKLQKMETFLAVARGSCEEPIFLECSYKGGKPGDNPILICAKGITFDSGGLCLKKPHEMSNEKCSIAGAAVAVAAVKALAQLKVPVNVVLVSPLCENIISGQCMKVGDVIKALNGLTIEIEDTDHEGRLIMADSLIYGQSVHKPSLVIDIAALTTGIRIATGGGAFGCFSNSEKYWCLMQQAGSITGDRPWRFPLWKCYDKKITNNPAVDLRNKGMGNASPCLGAAFLEHFVCGDWLHLDITGVGNSCAKPLTYLAGSSTTGRPTRTVIQLFEEIVKQCAFENKAKPMAEKTACR